MRQSRKGENVSRRKELDQRLQSLLKGRQVPVDEERLESMRQSLLKQVPGRDPVSGSGFLPRYRFALAFGAAMAVIGIFVLQPHSPLRQGDPKLSVAYELRGLMKDEDQLDHLLVLLNDFVSTRSQEGAIIDKEFYNRSLSGRYQGHELFETFYEWMYQPAESENSVSM